MDKQHENELKRLAKKALAEYRIARRQGYSPAVACAHAHFSIRQKRRPTKHAGGHAPRA